MKCKQCNKEFNSSRITALYCSAKCRKLAFLNGMKVSVPLKKEVSVPDIFKRNNIKEPYYKILFNKPLKELTAQDLYDSIDYYKQDTWTGSVEYKELIHRLDTISLKELRVKNYYIPNVYA